MALVVDGVRAVDRWQQGHRPTAFVFGVIKKFGDDRAPTLAVLLTYYGFMSLFPALLVFTTVLGFVGNERLEGSLVATTLAQFPVYGQQIGAGASHPLTGSAVGLVIGLLGLVYGSLGISQAGQHAMAQVWNVPGVARPGFPIRLVRSLVFFIVVGVGVTLTAGMSAVGTVAGQTWFFRVPVVAAAAGLNVLICLAVFRVLTPKSIDTRPLVPGAVAAGVAYTALLAVGTALIQRQLRHSQALYGQYAFVLGLLGWLFLVAQLTLYAAELNVVLARRLWPRSIVQPPLTPADEAVLRDIARQEERRPEQRVGVGFAPDAVTEATADASAPRPHGTTDDR